MTKEHYADIGIRIMKEAYQKLKDLPKDTQLKITLDDANIRELSNLEQNINDKLHGCGMVIITIDVKDVTIEQKEKN